MANTIRIKRSTGSAAPTSLANAELAYAEGTGILYIGEGTGGSGGSATNVRQIAGSSLFASQTVATVYAAPSGAAGAPSFRALVISDVNGLSTAIDSKAALSGATFTGGVTFGSTATFNGSVALGGAAAAATPATSDNSTTVATTAYVKAQGFVTSSGVTSVALSLPSVFTVSGSPVTTTGTLTAALATQGANVVFAGPGTGAAAAPTFRSLVSADLPAHTHAIADTTGLQTALDAKASLSGATFTGQVLLNGGAVVPSGYALTVNGLFRLASVAVTATAAELNLLDGATENSVVYGKAVIYGQNGEIASESISTGSVVSTGGFSVNDGAANYFVVDSNGGVTANMLETGSDAVIGGNLTVNGNLIVSGDTVTMSVGTIEVEDKNVVLGKVATPTTTTGNGGGVTVLTGASPANDKTLQWVNSTNSWTSNVDFDLASGKVYKINGTQISASNLSNGVIGSGKVVLETSPTLLGTPLAPTAAVDTNTTQVATTAYVVAQGYLKSSTAGSTYAPLASPTFSGAVYTPSIRNLLNAELVIDSYNDTGAGTHFLHKFMPLDGTFVLATNGGGLTYPDQTTQTTAFIPASYLSKAGNLDGLADLSESRGNLGLGSMAIQAASNVNISGGSIDNITLDGGSW